MEVISVVASAAVVATSTATSMTTGVDTSTIASVIATTVPSVVASILPSEVTTTQPVTDVVLQVPAALEVTAAFAGALAGGLAGVRLRFDLVGIATLAVVSGLGGGIIRDLLLQDYGVYALKNPRVLIAALIAALIAFYFYTAAEKLKWVMFLVDATALGLFAVVGTDKALLAGLTPIPAILLGTITAVGGGILRDVLTDDVPQVLRPGGFYATAAVGGSVLYITLVEWLNIVKPFAVITAVVSVLGIRLLTHFLGWKTPMATDLTPLVASAPRRVFASGGRAFGWARRASTRDADGALQSPHADDVRVERAPDDRRRPR